MRSGSSSTAVNLNSLFAWTYCTGIHNGQQVGFTATSHYPMGDTIGYQPGTRAVLWTGTAASAVDIHPIGYDASQALATNGTQQGGHAYIALPTARQHAMMWSGTPDTAVDMHPATYSDSRITAITATQQVGDGWIGPMGQLGSVRNTLVWSGTPDSVVDLNQYLPVG